MLGTFIGLMFHAQKAPFTDPVVRKAVALAIDGDATVQGSERGTALRGAPNNNHMPSNRANDIARTGGSVNYRRFSGSKVDALAAAKGKELDPQKRR